MLWLGLDTATPSCSVALARDGSAVAEITLHSDQTHARHLVGMIDRVLDLAGASTADLHGVALTLGPGSFTGLRIGLATAKGLCMAHGLEMAGVSSLDALAFGFRYVSLPVCAMIDARKGEVYTATYRFENGRTLFRTDEAARPPGDVLEEIREPTLFCGTGALAWRDRIFSMCGENAVIPDTVSAHTIGAGAVLSLAADSVSRDGRIDPALAVPVYIRPSDAEMPAR